MDTPVKIKGAPKLVCSLDGCEKVSRTRGLCHMHYSQLQRGNEFTPQYRNSRNSTDIKCTFVGCERPPHSHGHCSAHWRQHLTGKELRPIMAKSSPGNGHKKGGYWYVPTDEFGIIQEHRYVMSLHIGRPLLKHENVHHKSGDRLDNRIENLELWTKQQPAGQRVEDKLIWAREFIELYDPPEDESIMEFTYNEGA